MNDTPEAQTTLAVRNGNHDLVPSVHTAKWTLRRKVVDEALLKLPEEQRGPLRWLDDYGRSRNLSLREVAAQVKKPDGSSYDENTVYKILTGVHAARPDNFVRAVIEMRRPFTDREASAKIPFHWTSQARSIKSYVEKCQKYRKMGLIFGRNQGGKTSTLEQMQIELPFGQMQIFRVPTNGFLSQLVIRMCVAKKISVSNCVGEMKERLFASFDPSMIVVLDEMHQCYARTPSMTKPRLDTFEFAREIYDFSKAIPILTSTPQIHGEIFGDGPTSVFFEQLTHRSLPELVLNDLVPTNDLDEFADIVGLKPADGEARTLQDKVIANEGLGFWLMYLQCARGIAEKAQRPVRWADVGTAEEEFKKMSRRKK